MIGGGREGEVHGKRRGEEGKKINVRRRRGIKKR